MTILINRRKIGELINYQGWVVRIDSVGRELDPLPGGRGVFETEVTPIWERTLSVDDLARINRIINSK